MAFFSLGSAARLLTFAPTNVLLPAARMILPPAARMIPPQARNVFSLSLRQARNVLIPTPVTRMSPPPSEFSLRQARNVLIPPPAARMIPSPAAFSRGLTTFAINEDPYGQPCSSREGDRTHTFYLHLLVDNAQIYQDEHSLMVKFQVPGRGKQDIKVSLEDNQLKVVDLTKQGDEAGMLMLTVCACWFKASLITASVEHGIMTLVIPKEDGVESIDLRHVCDVD